MKESEPRTISKSNGKRARTTRAEPHHQNHSPRPPTATNGARDESARSGRRRRDLKRAKMSKGMGASNSRTAGAKEPAASRECSGRSSSPSSSLSSSPPPAGKFKARRGDKRSPDGPRPRRRASQTYFFKYQLAKNPLKAEEEDLRLALLASLQQCGNGSDDSRRSPSAAAKRLAAATVAINGSSSATKNSIQSPSSASKRSAASTRSLENSSPSPHSSTASSLPLISSTANEINRVTTKESNKKKLSSSSSSTRKGQQFKINGAAPNSASPNGKRRGSVESNGSSSIGSGSLKEPPKNKKKKASKDVSLLASSQTTTGSHSKKAAQNKLVGLSTSCSDFTSVQNRIKKAKKVLQNKKANESKRSNIISKYSALRKFPANSSTARNTSLLSPARKPKNGGKVNNFYCNKLSTASYNTTSANQLFVPYSPYAAVQKKDPPDEEYLKKYKPETEDFLTFICFRSTVPNYQNRLNETPKIETEDSNSTTILDCSSPCKTPEKKSPNHSHNQNTSDSQTTATSKHSSSTAQNNNNSTTNANSSPIIHLDTMDSPASQQRRPTRQSPRLASSNRKISENDNSNLTIITSNTIQDNSVTYEEDMKRASMALEDMAHEINSLDGMTKNEPSSNGVELSKSAYKSNKHLVKGLMTREFAGGFADEDTIFESISNHKL